MKKLLSILVLGLLFCFGAYGDENKPKDLEIIELKDPTTFGLKSGNNAHPVNRNKATRYCESKKKFAFQFSSTITVLSGDREGKRTKNHRYFCSRENLRIHPILGTGSWYWSQGIQVVLNSKPAYIIFSNYNSQQKEIWDDEENKTIETKSFKGESKSAIRQQCLDFGFKEGSEKFADCQLKIFMMLNKTSNNNQSSNETQTLILQDNDGTKRKIDPSVWDDLGNLSKDLLSGKSVSDSLGSVSSSSSSSSKIQCFKSGERVSGTNKICSYNCMGSEVTTNVASTRICPMSIDLN